MNTWTVLTLKLEMNGHMSVTEPCRRAFSLLELMIVVAIIGILVLLAMPNQSNLEQTQLLAAAKIFEADLNALQAIARADADPDAVFAVIMPVPDPIVDAPYEGMGPALACAPVGGLIQPSQPMASLAALLFAVQEENSYGACCYNGGASCQDNLSEAVCIDSKGVFHAGAACSADPCGAPVYNGACCPGETLDTCTDATSAKECESLGGIYHDGTACTMDQCLGACCYEESKLKITCGTMSRTACDELHGLFHGVDSSCTCDRGCGGKDGTDPCTPHEPPTAENLPIIASVGGQEITNRAPNLPSKVSEPVFVPGGKDIVELAEIVTEEKGTYYQIGRLTYDPDTDKRVFAALVDPKTGEDWLVPFGERHLDVRVKSCSFSSVASPLLISSTDGRIDRAAGFVLGTANLEAKVVIGISGTVEVEYGVSGALDLDGYEP